MLVKMRNGKPATFFRRAIVYADDAKKLERESQELRAVLEKVHRYMAGTQEYDHGVMDGNGDKNSLTPSSLITATLNRTRPN